MVVHGPEDRSEPGTARLERPEPAGQLARALDRGALLLVGPAGSGKTMALEEALRLRGGAVAWIHCSELDRDPGRLLGEVVDALRGAAPGTADALGELLAAATEPVGPRLAVRLLASELERLLVDPLTIVFDDAEQLHGAAEAVGAVHDLLVCESPRLRVAVASRRTLALRVSKLRSAGRLTEVGAADLAFSVRECAEVLRLRSGREPSDPEVDALWTATEGWPLGVALAARSEDGAATSAGSSANLHEYLAEELLGRFEPAMRDALIDSSVARELDPAVTEARELPPRFLDEVAARGVPLRELDHAGERVAYHPAVREFLAARLESERSQERRGALHARVAEALEGSGRGIEAVEHRLDAGGPDLAASAVARHGHMLVGTAPETVAGWLERLPAAARAAPELRLLEGRLALGAGRLEDAGAALCDAAAGYAGAGESPPRVVVEDVRSRRRAVAGDLAAVGEEIARLLAPPTESESDEAPRRRRHEGEAFARRSTSRSVPAPGAPAASAARSRSAERQPPRIATSAGCAITGRWSRTRRAGATTGTAGSEAIRRGSPPTPPGDPAPSGRGG